MRAVHRASGSVLPLVVLAGASAFPACASRGATTHGRSAAGSTVHARPEAGRRLVNEAPAHRRPNAPSAATHVQVVALTAETEAARSSPRTGTVTPLDANGIHPTPFRTPEGYAGWRVSIGGGRPLATPAIANGTVYVGGGFGSHEFYAFDARSGQTRWALTVSDDGPTAAVVEDNVVAFNTESCTLFVVDGTNGHPLWSRWLGDPLMSQPAIADGRLFMAFPGGGGHRLIAFELRSGRELWRVPIESDVISAPIASGDSVFATTFDGNVYRFRASDGGLAWREAYHATSAPWLWGDQVFVAHREDQHHAMLTPAARMYFGQTVAPSAPPSPVESVGRISTTTGASTQSNGGWHARSAPWLDQNVQNQTRYHSAQHESDTSVGFAAAPSTANAPAAAANIGQGTVRGMWEFQGSRPVVVEGRVFLTQGDHLVALDADTGREIWSIALHGVVTTEGGHLASPPAPAGGNLYIAGVAGEVVVVSQQDGRVIQTIHIGEPMRFQPAIVGGHLFVGTASGSLIGLDLNDAHADGWTMWGGTAAHNGSMR